MASEIYAWIGNLQWKVKLFLERNKLLSEGLAELKEAGSSLTMLNSAQVQLFSRQRSRLGSSAFHSNRAAQMLAERMNDRISRGSACTAKVDSTSAGASRKSDQMQTEINDNTTQINSLQGQIGSLYARAQAEEAAAAAAGSGGT